MAGARWVAHWSRRSRMAGGDTAIGARYGAVAAFVFVFNLIVGLGALALPRAFGVAGLVLGIVFLALVAFMAFMSATFVVEALSIANALRKLRGDAESDASASAGAAASSASASSASAGAAPSSSPSSSSVGGVASATSMHSLAASGPDDGYQQLRTAETDALLLQHTHDDVAAARAYARELAAKKAAASSGTGSTRGAQRRAVSESSALLASRGSVNATPTGYEPLAGVDADGSDVSPDSEAAHRRESQRIEALYGIDERVEVGMMAKTFFNVWGYRAFYLILGVRGRVRVRVRVGDPRSVLTSNQVYLFGDLAIYAAGVPHALRVLTCPAGQIDLVLGTLVIPCDVVYYVYLSLFAVVVLPFCFFNFQKTKYMQVFTMVCRNVAFLLMIVLAIIRIATGRGNAPSSVPIFNIGGVPSLFGVATYAFMCHHSIPGLISPVANKSTIVRLFLGDFIAVLAVYVLLCGTAVFAFGQSAFQDLYTENFDVAYVYPLVGNVLWLSKLISYFLQLFPVITLTANFPLICITLRNNIATMVPLWRDHPRYAKLRQPLFAVVSAVPALIVAYATSNVGLLVSITGAYAGLFVMLVVPALLVLFARRAARAHPELGRAGLANPYASPFRHTAFIGVTLSWAGVCLVFTIVNQVYTAVTGHSL